MLVGVVANVVTVKVALPPAVIVFDELETVILLLGGEALTVRLIG